jgi:RNA polymerase sigma-70 factor (family 1)
LDNSSLHTDKVLFQRIAEGNEQAFAEIFNAYVPRLMPFAQRLTEDKEAAKEIVQETFLRLWLGRDKLEAIDNPAGWIFTIASNQCYKYLRRKVLKEASSNHEVEVNIPDKIAADELNVLIQTAIASLSEQRKKVFILSREHGLSIPEIAEQLKLSPNTVKNTLVSALKTVREHLESNGYLFSFLLLWWLKK